MKILSNVYIKIICVFMFVLLYIMPWIANMFTIARDAFTLGVGEVLTGRTGMGVQETALTAMEMSDEVDILLALLFLALMVAPIFYVVGYASIALQETGLFVAFPVVALLSIKDKKLLNSWCGMFFSNLAVPLIDYCFLVIPLVLKKLLPASTAGETFAYSVVTICCVWSAQPARNAILRLFGNMGGAQANIGGMAALGMAAMRMMGGSKGGGNASGGSSASATDDLTNAQRFENLAGGFNEALTETNRATEGIRSLEDIDAIEYDENDKKQLDIFKTAEILLNKKVYTNSYLEI